MNSYERYMGMIHGERVDCIPRVPILMHFAADFARASYADFARDYRVLVDANWRLVERFNFDQLDIMSDPYRETTAFGGRITYVDDGVPRCTAPLGDTTDLSVLGAPNAQQSERLRNAIEALRAYKALAWQRYAITGWVEGPAAEAADLRGVENFLTDLLTDPVWACELMDKCVDTAIAFALAQIEAGADTIGMGDAVASQLAPDAYAEFVAPREKRIIDAVHGASGLVRLHICGNITPILEHVAGIGADIVDCDWMVDMKTAREALGPGVTLTGNLDPVARIMNGEPEAIHRAYRELFETVGRPYFVNAGCEIPRGTPYENLGALCRPIPVG